MEAHVKHVTLDPVVFAVVAIVFVALVIIGVKKGLCKGANTAIFR